MHRSRDALAVNIFLTYSLLLHAACKNRQYVPKVRNYGFWIRPTESLHSLAAPACVRLFVIAGRGPAYSRMLFTKVRTPVYVRKFKILRTQILTCVTLFTKLSYLRKIVNSCVNICTVWAVVRQKILVKITSWLSSSLLTSSVSSTVSMNEHSSGDSCSNLFSKFITKINCVELCWKVRSLSIVSYVLWCNRVVKVRM